MTSPTICFIGAGNMAGSLIGGLIANGHSANRIIACDPNRDRLEQLNKDFSVTTETDNNLALERADIVILAVKPQLLQAVCRSLQPDAKSLLYISIAAGVREVDINRWLGGNRAIVRCMPNTPALVGLGASALYANAAVDLVQRELAQNILASTGSTVWVDDESELDAVTAISGSGPAYFFLFIEALQHAAIELGLAPETASQLARQTALGAATMARDGDVVTLRQQVTSKGGTTERAIRSFEESGLRQLVVDATRAAAERSRELADLLGQDSATNHD